MSRCKHDHARPSYYLPGYLFCHVCKSYLFDGKVAR